HDWVIKPQMRTVRGTAEINSWGGYERQFQVRIDPDRLDEKHLNFEQVVEAIKKNNKNVGGGQIRRGTQMLPGHRLARTTEVEQIKTIRITTGRSQKNGDGTPKTKGPVPVFLAGSKPIRVGDVADVVIGHEIRRGAVTADGKGEVVLGLGFMLMGENSHQVTWAMKDKLDEVKASLPRNVRVETVYDRTELVDHVIDTVRNNLFEGGLFVVAVLFLFLGNLRAALIVAAA